MFKIGSHECGDDGIIPIAEILFIKLMNLTPLDVLKFHESIISKCTRNGFLTSNNDPNGKLQIFKKKKKTLKCLVNPTFNKKIF